MPIIFTKSGYVGDGQHRLSGVVESQTAQTFWLAFGDPDENFFVYDTGKIRSAGDIFAMNGVPNHKNAAAAARWVFCYQHGSLVMTRGGSSSDAEINTPERLYRFYLKHEGLQDSMWVGAAFAKMRMPSPTLMVALHYIATQKGHGDFADSFFKRLASGVGFLSQRDPAYKLREHITKLDDIPSREALTCWTVQAWNAARTRKGFGTPKITTDGSFPRMI